MATYSRKLKKDEVNGGVSFPSMTAWIDDELIKECGLTHGLQRLGKRLYEQYKDGQMRDSKSIIRGISINGVDFQLLFAKKKETK